MRAELHLRLTPFARRWGLALLIGSVAIGVGAGYVLVPSLPPLTVQLPERGAVDAGAVFGMAVSPPRRRPLKTPFTLLHEARNMPERPSRGSPAAPSVPAAAPSRLEAVRLVGVVTADVGSRAILLWEGRQVVLAPGESCGALTLLSVAEDAARVREAGAERLLRLPDPMEAAQGSALRREGRG